MMKIKNDIDRYMIAALVLFWAVVFFSQVLSGCATTQNLDTPEKQYVTARAQLNLFLEQYLDMQDDVPDHLHKTMVVSFKSADTLLDAWEPFAADPNYDFASDYKAWIKIKSDILNVFKEIYDE